MIGGDRPTSSLEIHHEEFQSSAIEIGRWTFQTPAIRSVIEAAIGERVLNACAGKTELAIPDGSDVVRNDINPAIDADYHYDVCEIDGEFEPNSFDTVVFDPPFSRAKAEKHYDGLHVGDIGKAREALAKLVGPGGRFVELGLDPRSVAVRPNWVPEERHVFHFDAPRHDPVFVTIDEHLTDEENHSSVP